jgi:archaellum component FlaC
VEVDLGDPEELMGEYEQICKDLNNLQSELKQELIKALGSH